MRGKERERGRERNVRVAPCLKCRERDWERLQIAKNHDMQWSRTRTLWVVYLQYHHTVQEKQSCCCPEEEMCCSVYLKHFIQHSTLFREQNSSRLKQFSCANGIDHWECQSNSSLTFSGSLRRQEWAEFHYRNEERQKLDRDKETWSIRTSTGKQC